ncbi:MAG TPA: sugar phosphate isomerase/epimerase [Armatimonadetes bacterium]|nr:sugar phosphate isomerase/epimerase [Armatimonadota bacterium]
MADSKWVYCLNTSTIRPADILEKIRIASEANYDAIELWNDDMTAYIESGGSMQDIVTALADHGLKVPSVIAIHNWMDTEGDEHRRALDEAKRRMEQAVAVGAPYIVATPPRQMDTPLDYDRAGERYRELLELGRQIGVLPALEFLGFSETVYRIDQAWEIVKRAADPQGTVVLDTFHLYRGGSTLDDAPDLIGERIAIFHFNDVPSGIPREQLTDADRVYPGDGILPLREWVGIVQARGYRGAISLELFNRTLWERDLREVARIGLEKVKAVLET